MSETIVNKTGLDGKEDYLGFSFNGIHSSKFHIIRVSQSNRYKDSFLSNIKETTVELPRVNGNTLISTKYESKIFSIDFAYDYVRDSELIEMKSWLSDYGDGFKNEKKLILDELPFLYWDVIVQGQPSFSYLAFDERNNAGEKERVYKGEGSVTFIAHDPFAKSVSKILDDIIDIDEEGKWKKIPWVGQVITSYSSETPPILPCSSRDTNIGKISGILTKNEANGAKDNQGTPLISNGYLIDRPFKDIKKTSSNIISSVTELTNYDMSKSTDFAIYNYYNPSNVQTDFTFSFNYTRKIKSGYLIFFTSDDYVNDFIKFQESFSRATSYGVIDLSKLNPSNRYYISSDLWAVQDNSHNFYNGAFVAGQIMPLVPLYSGFIYVGLFDIVEETEESGELTKIVDLYNLDYNYRYFW